MKKPGRILIVGGLAAGPAAAAKAKRLNPNLDITLYEQGEFISYGTCSMPFYVGGTIARSEDLILFTPERFEKEKGCEVKTLHRVEEIMPYRRKIVVRDLRTDTRSEVAYDRLLLATGSRVRHGLPIQEPARNLFTIKTLSDAIYLKRFLDDSGIRKVIVIGGGFIGMEMAEAMRHRGLDVEVLDKTDEPMGTLEPESRRIVLDELQRNDVHFSGGQNVTGFRIVDGLVTHVLTSDADKACDLVIVATGFEPNTTLAQSAKIRCGKLGGIIVNSHLLTSADHVYAAGACCEINHTVSGKPMLHPLATVSNKMGWIAGSNLAGHPAVYEGSVRTIAVKIFDLEVASVGLGSREAEMNGLRVMTEVVVGHSRGSHYPGRSPILVKLVADRASKRLVGANLIGEEGAAHRVNVLATAITAMMTVDQIADLDLMYTPPFSPLWDPILIAANRMVRQF